MGFQCGIQVVNPKYGRFVMIVRGDPTYPGVRVLLGDYAVRQNEADRSQLLLNHVMDTLFKPTHLAWKSLWQAQQDAEERLERLKRQRDESACAMLTVIRHVMRVLLFRHGGDESVLDRFLPGGAAVVFIPPSRLLSELEVFAPRLTLAPETALPTSLRMAFDERLLALRGVQANLELEVAQSQTALQARLRADEAWGEAFAAFHRAVEYVAFKGRGVVRDWVRDWVVADAAPLELFRSRESISEALQAAG